MTNGHPALDQKSLRAVSRLKRRHRQLARKGGFRALADEVFRGLVNVKPNMSYVYEFVMNGKLPANEEIREKLLTFGTKPQEKKPMDILQQKLFDTMRFYHVGEGKSIKKRDLLKEIYGPDAAADESYNNPNDRRLRQAIEEINHDHEGLICSSPDAGYFWASSLSEGLEAVDASTRRAATQMENASHLKRNLQRAFGGQLRMEV